MRGASLHSRVRPSVTVGAVFLSRGVKWPECGLDHPPSSDVEAKEIKEGVELYLYTSPFGLYAGRTLCLSSCLVLLSNEILEQGCPTLAHRRAT